MDFRLPRRPDRAQGVTYVGMPCFDKGYNLPIIMPAQLSTALKAGMLASKGTLMLKPGGNRIIIAGSTDSTVGPFAEIRDRSCLIDLTLSTRYEVSICR